MKLVALILIFLSIFCVVQAQVFDKVPPSAVPGLSSGEYAPFSNNNRPTILRGIDPDDEGDPIGGTGGDDGNGNQNDIPVTDGVWMMMLAALCYAIKVRRRISKE